MLTVQIFDSTDPTRLLADVTGRLHEAVGGGGLSFSTNGHGFASLSAPLVTMSLAEAFECYSWPGLPHVVVSDGAAGVVWEGRLEDIAIVDGGVALVALGYQRALYDLPYTALWSVTGSADWREVTADDTTAMQPQRFEMDNNNRIYIAPRKDETFFDETTIGAMTYALPHGGERGIIKFTCGYSMLLPSGWEFRVISCASDFSSTTTINTVTATGSTQTGSLDLSISSTNRLWVEVRNNSGSTATPSDTTGTNYLKLTDIRIKSTSAVTVLASAIAEALAVWVNAENPTQLRADALRIEATGTDLQNEIYEDALPADILDRLARLHGYEWGVYEDRRLYFRDRGAGNRWYVDATAAPELQRSLENLRNSAYAVYRSEDGRTMRTLEEVDAHSQARFGLTRRGFINVQTTSATEAQTHRGLFLSDRADASARANVPFDRLYDSMGSVWPLYAMRAGDTVTVRNLPPTLGTDIDRIRTFRVAETEYDAATGELSIAPEEPLPTLDVMLARREAGL